MAEAARPRPVMGEAWRAYRSGCRRLGRELRLWSLLYLLNFGLAALVVLPGKLALDRLLGLDPRASRLAAGFDLSALAELLFDHGELLPALCVLACAVILLHLLGSQFLYGGILETLGAAGRPRPCGREFFAACAARFGVLCRLLLLALPLYVGVVLGAYLLQAAMVAPLSRVEIGGRLWLASALRGGALAIGVAAWWLVSACLDSARWLAATSDQRSARQLLRQARPLVSARLMPMLVLEALLTATWLAPAALHLAGSWQLPMASGAGLVLLMLLRQLVVLWRVGARLLGFAALRELLGGCLGGCSPHSRVQEEVISLTRTEVDPLGRGRPQS